MAITDALGFDGAKLGALLRLRWRTVSRRVSRERGRLVGGLLLVIIVGPFALGIAVATWLGYDRLPHHVAAQLLAATLTGLWMLWILAPVLTFSVNEGLDVTRLLVYPIRQRDLTASLLLGTLFDLPTYLALPLLVSVLAGWSDGKATAVVLAATILAYGHMVLAGQVVVAGAGGMLRSRRFRDVALIVFSLLGSSCYFIQRGAFALGARYVDPEALAEVRILPVLQWLPPGSSARAIERAAAGAWLESVLWLTYGALLLAGVAWLWWRLLVRLTTGGGFPALGLPRAAPAAELARSRSATAPAALAWLPPDIAQLMVKELRSVWRTPRRRVMLLQSLLMPFVLGAFAVLRSDRPHTVPTWIGFALAGYALFASWGASQNMLGYEGTGLPMLLLTPVPRDRILLGKSLGMALVVSGATFVLGLGALALVPTWVSVVGLMTALSIPPIALGVGAVVSVRYPWPIDLESTQRTNVFATSGGCATGLASIFVLPLVTGLLTMPPMAILAVTVLLDQAWLGFVTAAATLAYGWLVLWLGSRFAGSQLLGREPEVVAATRVAD